MAHPKPHTVLTDIEIDTVISFFLYYMGTERRSQLMSEYPRIYNRLMGSSIVKTVRVSDNTEIGNTSAQETK